MQFRNYWKLPADKITGTLHSYGLDLINLRGQTYDGAGNMAGSIKGTAAIIREQYPLALYLHCSSHWLNLAVIKSLQIPNIRNMIGVMDRVYIFFDSHPKRQIALDKAITETQPTSSVTKLKSLCRTRWIQRIDAQKHSKSCPSTCQHYVSQHSNVALYSLHIVGYQLYGREIF